MKKHLLANAVLAAVSTFGAFQAASAADNPITANVTVTSDYRFRGISQTLTKPALQGGFDYAHSSGFYVGNWNSNVDFGPGIPGANLEMDLYGGYKGEFKGVGYDVGAIRYYYPSTVGLDTTEVYGGLSYGPLSGKLYYTVSDGYFGFRGAAPATDAKGTTYLDLGYTDGLPFWDLTLNARVGIVDIKNDNAGANAISYTHYTLGVTKPVAGLTLGLTLHNVTDLDNKGFYQANDGRGVTRNLYKSAAVLSVSKSF